MVVLLKPRHFGYLTTGIRNIGYNRVRIVIGKIFGGYKNC